MRWDSESATVRCASVSAPKTHNKTHNKNDPKIDPKNDPKNDPKYSSILAKIIIYFGKNI